MPVDGVECTKCSWVNGGNFWNQMEELKLHKKQNSEQLETIHMRPNYKISFYINWKVGNIYA